ncbi:MAG: AAA family ATPase [Pikeienuella sp.]
MKIEFSEKTHFVETKAHARFIEFADACIENRYIGVCHGRPGVGKTRSAYEFAKWPEPFGYNINGNMTPELERQVTQCKAIFITARVANTPKTIGTQLSSPMFWLGHARMRFAGTFEEPFLLNNATKAVPLVIVDEADRLSLKSFEHLRHIYDECGMGLILLGMPGIEKRLARYPQLYSRIGFVHEFKPLSDDEMRFLFSRRSEGFGLTFDPDTFEHVEALSMIIRITGGNFRLIERLFAQMKRIMTINAISDVSGGVVEAARECLVIGPTD